MKYPIINQFNDGDIVTFPQTLNPVEEITKYPQDVSVIIPYCEILHNGEIKFLRLTARAIVSIDGRSQTVYLYYGDERFELDFGTKLVHVKFKNYGLVEYESLKKIVMLDSRLTLIKRLAGKTVRCKTEVGGPLNSVCKSFIEINHL